MRERGEGEGEGEVPPLHAICHRHTPPNRFPPRSPPRVPPSRRPTLRGGVKVCAGPWPPWMVVAAAAVATAAAVRQWQWWWWRRRGGWEWTGADRSGREWTGVPNPRALGVTRHPWLRKRELGTGVLARALTSILDLSGSTTGAKGSGRGGGTSGARTPGEGSAAVPCMSESSAGWAQRSRHGGSTSLNTGCVFK